MMTNCIDCNSIVSKRNAVRCRKCNSFFKRKDNTLTTYEYKRFWYIKKKYGLTQDDFWGYWMAGHGKCYICKIPLKQPEKTRGQKTDVVMIDHSHTSKKIRGLLCKGCNTALGLLKDDISTLKSAIKYLEDQK